MKTIDTTKARIEVAKIAIESIKMLAHLEGTDLASLLAELNAEDSQLNAATPAVQPAKGSRGKKASGTVIATIPAPTPAPSIANDGVDERGYHPRNGRWEMLNKMFAEVGFNKSTGELFDEANKRGAALGLEPLRKTTFYSMLSVAKKAAGYVKK
jgi:hypothetical protein